MTTIRDIEPLKNNYIPETILDRETETERLRQALQRIQNVYIHGPRGTGKTLVVKKELEKPDGMVERKINGQKRVFQAPVKAELTETGLQTLKEEDREDLEAYQNLTHRELVEKVHALEDRIKSLEQKFEGFREQVKQKLETS